MNEHDKDFSAISNISMSMHHTHTHHILVNTPYTHIVLITCSYIRDFIIFVQYIKFDITGWAWTISQNDFANFTASKSFWPNILWNKQLNNVHCSPAGRRPVPRTSRASRAGRRRSRCAGRRARCTWARGAPCSWSSPAVRRQTVGRANMAHVRPFRPPRLPGLPAHRAAQRRLPPDVAARAGRLACDRWRLRAYRSPWRSRSTSRIGSSHRAKTRSRGTPRRASTSTHPHSRVPFLNQWVRPPVGLPKDRR